MENTIKRQIVEYCLYARKSSEDDERQAMSIDSQIKEMREMAKRDGLIVKEIRRESHSAKISGQRPVFNRLILDIRNGLFNGILTWAPDRLSRNAGDLGQIVDLIDQGDLVHIKTFSQAFSNTPSEKFLLMILCSQAKLENDQKGLNVKRGIRAKCNMGWRPGRPPIGYFNRAVNGVKDIIIDPERAPFITEMFERVANGESGRKIKRWFDEKGMTSRAGKKITLSLIYLLLKTHFYYGMFEYPEKSGNWYKGSHKPLTTKETFDKVQQKLFIPFKKAKWGSKEFAFKDCLKCATCGASVVGEDKFRKRKWGDPVFHIYYHCSKQKTANCPEPYITEEELIKQLIIYFNYIYSSHPKLFILNNFLKASLELYRKTRDEVLLTQDIDPDDRQINIMDFVRYIIRSGSMKEKKEVTGVLNRQLYLHNETITTTPLV